MESTDRIALGEDGIYRWYYDRKYGQDNMILKTTLIVFGIMALLFGILIAALPPDGKISKGVVAAELYGILAFAGLMVWVVNIIIHRNRGGKYRIFYEMDPQLIRVLNSGADVARNRKMGAAVAAAGVLTGHAVSGLVRGAVYANAINEFRLPLSYVKKVILKPKLDIIVLKGLGKRCDMYVPADDFKLAEEFIMENTGDDVSVIERA